MIVMMMAAGAVFDPCFCWGCGAMKVGMVACAFVVAIVFGCDDYAETCWMLL